MKKHIMIAAALLAATPTKARDAVQDDGNELLTLCDSGYDFNQGMCLGYIRGLSVGVDTMLTLQDKKICYPLNITVGQMRDVVAAYIRRNPGKRHESNLILFMRATVEAWPCP